MGVFDFVSFCNDFHIHTSTDGPNSARGWVQTQCCFCDDRSDHLGFNLNYGYFSCWKCGYKTNLEVVRMLVGVNWQKAKKIIEYYELSSLPHIHKEKIERPESLKLPYGTGKLTKYQKRYLMERNYDPNKLVQNWEIKGTGPVGSYKHRIIIPINYNKRLVSYTGRDHTHKSSLRYKACKTSDEVIPHKETLYGIDHATTHKAIIVEGPTDVWRLGPGAVATFGIKFKPQQVYLLAEKFTHVFIMFDKGYQAQEQASKLGHSLADMGLLVDIIPDIKDDPGSLTQEEADEIRKELLG